MEEVICIRNFIIHISNVFLTLLKSNFLVLALETLL